MTITKAKFNAYRKVQMSGKYNMITEAIKAIPATGLCYEEYLMCIGRYKEYVEKYGKYEG